MNIGEAVKERIIELCRERDISINKLCSISGVTQSTVNNIVSGRNNSDSSRIMIFFMAFASFRVYGSEKREKTPMCKNRIYRFDGDGIL